MRTILGIAALLAACLALAEAPAPDAMVRQITGDVLAAVAGDQAIQTGDEAKLSALVRTQILPHFDFSRATAIAVGPAWRRATPEQREALTKQFEALLVRTYSGTLAAYRHQTIIVLPVHMAPSDNEVTVSSQVRQSGEAPIAIDYTMAREGDEWKVFDITVDGMSLVENYRQSFAQAIDARGIDGLIDELAAKNSATA